MAIRSWPRVLAFRRLLPNRTMANSTSGATVSDSSASFRLVDSSSPTRSTSVTDCCNRSSKRLVTAIWISPTSMMTRLTSSPDGCFA